MAVAAPALLFSQEQKPLGAELFARADEASNIRTAETTPFRIKISFQVFNVTPEPVGGVFARLFVTQEKWRSETVMPPYQRTEWGSVNGYWRQRSTTVEPSPMRDIDRIIAYAMIMKQHKQIRWTGVKHKFLEDKPVTTVEGLFNGRAPWKYYFDDATGVLFRLDFFGGQARYEWSDFQPFGNKLFPRTMKVYEGDKLTIALHVDELVHVDNTDPKLLVHAAGAEQRPACEGMKFPQLVEATPVFVPAALRDTVRQTGSIPILTAMIGKDGLARDTAISRTSGSTVLDDAAVRAVKDYKWQPAMCGNDVVEIEIEFEPKMWW